jgi:hypothetical protein
MGEYRDEPRKILIIVEKLLMWAESQAETDLADLRARQHFRREVVEQLDRIEDYVKKKAIPPVHVEEDPTVLTRSEAKSIIKKALPYVLTALAALSHLLRSYFH